MLKTTDRNTHFGPRLSRAGLTALTAALVFSASCVDGQHKTPPQSNLPTYQNSSTLLPEPILDRAPELIELYWATWKLAFDHFRSPPARSPLPSNYMDAAFSTNIFQWDTIFMIPFAAYANHVFSVVGSLDNFYARQHKDGFICREISIATGADFIYGSLRDVINPPLFAWAELEHARVTGDISRYARVIQPLSAYADYLETARRSDQTTHGLYWNTGLGSGMDNTPRRGSGWVDMSSQMVVMYRSLAEMAETLGQRAKAQDFQSRADSIATKIQRYMWDDKDGIFYDIDDQGRHVKHKTIASFWPMFARIATPAQVERLVTHLKDPRTFWRENVWPSLAADHPSYSRHGFYWRGGVWAPTNAMVIRGLENYPQVIGTEALARAASAKYLENVETVYRETQTIWEFYKPESAAPGWMWWFWKGRPDFVGWSGIGPIQLLIENILGFRIDAQRHTLAWHVSEIGRHGIRRLQVGAFRVSLEASARKAASDALEVVGTVELPIGTSPRVLNLEIESDGHTVQESISVPADRDRVELKKRWALQ